ncbi:MAG TPA: hypothetical protein VFU14_13280 [Acidimicrobiales bacterium]|nr:hypothetical protein [Acidimicrobiales bacterium]
MLTLFLLVVLGGGAGLLAVSLVDSRGLSRLVGRFERPSLRASRAGHTTPAPGSAAPHEVGGTPLGAATTAQAASVELDDQPVIVEAEIIETDSVGEVVAVAAPTAPPANGTAGQPTALLPAGPPRARRADARSVPAAYTAIEGSYREVARPTLARRLASLVSLVVVVVLLGLALAAVAGAAIGAAAEVLDRAIG